MRKSKLIVVPIVTAMVSAMLVGCGKTDAEPTSTLESVENVEVVETEENAETVATDGSTTETVESVVNEEVPEESASVETIESTEVSENNTEEVEESAGITILEIVEGEEKTHYTFTELSATMYATNAVNVRQLPLVDGEKLGALSVNEEVSVTGQCNETGWYRIDYNGMEGYVSNNYLGNEKVVIEETPTVNSSTGNLNILDPEPEGNYVPSTYEENGYTFLDLGMCIVSYGEKEKYSDLNLTECIGTDNGMNGPIAIRQCLETGAIEIWQGSKGSYWISGDGVRLGW